VVGVTSSKGFLAADRKRSYSLISFSRQPML